uniref:Uncharacterized protein n=1 Tax=Panagrolaimus sp. PS1159 TaxID=55785 RepID=A0AC35GJ39_9BILA
MADTYDERFQKGIEKMQSLGESMEETINQHRKKPKLVCNNTALKILIQKAQNLYNEMDCCQNEVDETTETLISDKTKAERKIQECEKKVATAENEIETLNVSIDIEERGIRVVTTAENEIETLNVSIDFEESGIRVCEQQIRKLEETLERGRRENFDRENRMRTNERVAVGSGAAFGVFGILGLVCPILFIPAAGMLVTSVVSSALASVEHDNEMKKYECEQQIRKLEETLERRRKENFDREKRMRTNERVAVGSEAAFGVFGILGLVCPILFIPAAGMLVTSVVSSVEHDNEMKKGEVNLAAIRNRIQNQKNEIVSYQSRIEKAKQSIEKNQKDIELLKIEIQHYETKIRKYLRMVSALILCKKILFHWLQFLNELTLSMNHLEYRFAAGTEMVAVKDTVAYQKYVQLLNGSDANKSLKAATKMRQITSTNITNEMNALSIEFGI